MRVTFNFEGCDESAAFFALYAGLRMYKEQREKRTPQGQFSIAAAEAAGMMEDLKENFPKEYTECEEEYSIAYPVSQFPSPQEVTERIMQLEMTLLISRQAMMNALATFGTMVQTNKYDKIAIENLKEAVQTINQDIKSTL